MSTRVCVGVCVCLLALGCSKKQPAETGGDATGVEPASWTAVAVEEMTSDQLDQRGTCLAARDDLATAMMGELQEALAAGSHAEAIEVCSLRAPEIAAEVSNTHAVLMGRTSGSVK